MNSQHQQSLHLFRQYQQKLSKNDLLNIEESFEKIPNI